MIRLLLPTIVALAFGLHAQTAPDAAELTKLLKDFLAGHRVTTLPCTIVSGPTT